MRCLPRPHDPAVGAAHLGPQLDGGRGAAHGGQGLLRGHLLREPREAGLAQLHSDHWDPFLDACQETGTVVCLHIGSSSQVGITAMDAPSTR